MKLLLTFHIPILQRQLSPMVVEGSNKTIIGLIVFLLLLIGVIIIGGKSQTKGKSHNQIKRGNLKGQHLEN